MPERGPRPHPAAPSPATPPADPVIAGQEPASSGAAVDDSPYVAEPGRPEPIDLAPEPFSLTGPDEPDDEAAPRSRLRRVVLNALLLIGVAGLGVLGWAGWQISAQKDATVTVPAQIAGLRLDDSQDGRDTADYLQTALTAEVDLDNAVGAVYTDGSKDDVLFFGGTALIWSPGSDLDTAFGLISDDQGAVTGVHDVPAGKFGGTMRCGTTKTSEGQMPVCGWADHGSLALAMFPNRTEQASAALLLQIRDAAQRRD
jgi:hypothetical protein